MMDRQISRVAEQALARLQRSLQEASPVMAAQTWGWMASLAGGSPAWYFTQLRSFPMLRFPLWLETTLQGHPDLALQEDLAYSTINGYYFIRLIDNLMDGHASVELSLLPALALFHTEFHDTYRRHFVAEHSFWDQFRRSWFACAAATLEDAQLHDLDRWQFENIAACKTCAAEIPIAAVCYLYEREDLLSPWFRLLHLFGCWHQMWNDVFGWLGDTRRGTRSYFLSEADRQRSTSQTVSEWVLRGGLDWGLAQLDGWMDAMKALALELDSEEALCYLARRTEMLAERKIMVDGHVRQVVALLDAAESERHSRDS